MSNTMANPLAKTDVTSHLIMEAGFTTQVAVDENGQTCQAIGPYDKTFCSYCLKLIKITSMGKHQDVGNPKCCPSMQNGSCVVLFKPVKPKGTIVYSSGARCLTAEEKKRNEEIISSLIERPYVPEQERKHSYEIGFIRVSANANYFIPKF